MHMSFIFIPYNKSNVSFLSVTVKNYLLKGNIPSSLAEALKSCSRQFLPSIYLLLKIFLTIPVTSATAERSFSALRVIKNHLRSTMGEERLSGLATIYIHNGEHVDLDKAKGRKLQL